jgi:peptide/nickel transport system substrate-binding protein
MQDPAGKGVYGVGTNGTGPYTLESIQTNQKAVFKARPDYWGQKPAMETVEFIDLGDDQSAIFAAVAAGQVDGVFDIDFLQMPAYEKLPGVKVYSTKTATCGTLNMRVTDKPFDNPKVRLAMRYGLDNAPIMAIAIRGNGMEGEHHHVAPVHPEYAPLPKMARDVEKAKSLLAEAGHPDGFDAEVYVMAESPWHLAAVQAMTEQLKEIGARLTIKVLPSTQFWDVSDKVALSFSDWAHRPLGLQMLALVYRTGVDWNSTKWSNKEFDTLLTKAEGILDPNDRKPIMAELEKIMQQDGPVVMPFWVNIATAYSQKVAGFRMHPAGTIFLNELSLAA